MAVCGGHGDGPGAATSHVGLGGGGGGEGKGEGEGEGEGSEALSRGWNVTFSFLCLTYKEMIVRNGVSQF